MATKKTNSVFVEFSDGHKHKLKTTKTIPEIQEKFMIGKYFIIPNETQQIRVESLTIS